MGTRKRTLASYNVRVKAAGESTRYLSSRAYTMYAAGTLQAHFLSWQRKFQWSCCFSMHEYHGNGRAVSPLFPSATLLICLLLLVDAPSRNSLLLVTRCFSWVR